MKNIWKYITAALAGIIAILGAILFMRKREPVTPRTLVTGEAMRALEEFREVAMEAAKKAEEHRLAQARSVAVALDENGDLHDEIENCKSAQEVEDLLRREGL